MARASKIQNSFTAGELSALLLGRQDFEQYAKGLFTCMNGVPMTQGPWTRRPGTAYMHQVKFNNKATVLVPFQYSTTQTYQLEFGDLYIRFYTAHGLLTNTSQSITSITNANPGVLGKVAHGYNNGDRIFLSAIAGMTALNGVEVVVTNKTADTYELWDSDGVKINTTALGTFTAGTQAKIFEVVTTYTAAEVADVRYVQSADTLYLFHANHKPATLVRVSALSWTLANIVFTDGPYDVLNTTATTITSSATTGACTLTASGTTGINGGLGFLATDVGRYVRMKIASSWGYVRIDAFTDSTHVNGTVMSTLGGVTATVDWRLGVWSDTTGYPVCGVFCEDRLYAGGPAVYPQRIDGSNVSQYTNFSPSATDGTVSASNAVSATLNSDDVNAIKWLLSVEKGLLVGTARGEWVVRGATIQGEAITPTNITAKPTSKRGSANVGALSINGAGLFVQRSNKKLREMAYVLDNDRFNTPDMTQLAEHVGQAGILKLAFQEQPQPILWCVRADGVMLGFTYDREAGVVAWHRHELGGFSDVGHTLIPGVESICVTSAPDGTHDELYMIVNRYINGGTKRYIEYMTPFWEVGNSVQTNAIFLDCCWTVVNGSPSVTVTGLHHLEGETLAAYTDGMIHAPVVVTNGTVTLTAASTIVTLGYPYNSDGYTMPIDGGSQDGSSQGKLVKVDRVGFWLADTLGIQYGPDEFSLDEIIFRVWGANFGQATPLFTGVTRQPFDSGVDRLGQVFWRCSGPFPATVCAVMPQFTVADDS